LFATLLEVMVCVRCGIGDPREAVQIDRGLLCDGLFLENFRPERLQSGDVLRRITGVTLPSESPSRCGTGLGGALEFERVHCSMAARAIAAAARAPFKPRRTPCATRTHPATPTPAPIHHRQRNRLVGPRMKPQNPREKPQDGASRRRESRVIPMSPELRPYLENVFEQAEPDSEYVIARYRDTNVNL